MPPFFFRPGIASRRLRLHLVCVLPLPIPSHLPFPVSKTRTFFSQKKRELKGNRKWKDCFFSSLFFSTSFSLFSKSRFSFFRRRTDQKEIENGRTVLFLFRPFPFSFLTPRQGLSFFWRERGKARGG